MTQVSTLFVRYQGDIKCLKKNNSLYEFWFYCTFFLMLTVMDPISRMI